MVMTFFLTPVWLIYWWARFGEIRTADVDYAAAKRNWTVSLFLWLLMMAVLFTMVVLPIVLTAIRS